MTLLYKNQFIAFVVLLLTVSADASENKKNMIITIPKAGTNLLKKCLTLMNIDGATTSRVKKGSGKSSFMDIHNPIKNSFAKLMKHSDQKLISRHLLHTKETEELIAQTTSANLFMIRDPRSQLVSAAFAAQSHRVDGAKKSIEELLLDFIYARRENYIPMKKHTQLTNMLSNEILLKLDLLWTVGALEFYKFFIPWMKAKNFYTVRFEKLVGPHGGGSEQEQYEEIKKIAQHLGVERSEKEIQEIINNLFGGTKTFREGKKDSWKKHFTPAVKKAFQANSGLMQLLIDLDYEQDTNW